jgi:hypothetical protein
MVKKLSKSCQKVRSQPKAKKFDAFGNHVATLYSTKVPTE